MSAQSPIAVPAPTVDVIILASRYNDTAELLACLRRQTHLPGHVLLVDTSEDNAIESMAEQVLNGSDIHLISAHRPDLGTASGRNLAISWAAGKYVAVLDDDLLIRDNYLEQAVAFLEVPWHQDVAAATLIGPYPGAAASDEAGRMGRRLARLVKLLFLSDSLRPGHVLPTGFRSELGGETRPVQWVQGGNAVWRRAVLASYKYDEVLERYPYALSEDVELSARVARAHRLFVVAASGVHHKASPGRRLDPAQFGESLVRNHRYISRKLWPGWHNRLLFGWCTIGIAASALGSHALERSTASRAYLRGVLRGAIDVQSVR